MEGTVAILAPGSAALIGTPGWRPQSEQELFRPEALVSLLWHMCCSSWKRSRTKFQCQHSNSSPTREFGVYCGLATKLMKSTMMEPIQTGLERMLQRCSPTREYQCQISQNPLGKRAHCSRTNAELVTHCQGSPR